MFRDYVGVLDSLGRLEETKRQERTIQSSVQLLERDVEEMRAQVMKLKMQTFPTPDRGEVGRLVYELEGLLVDINNRVELLKQSVR